MDQKASTEDAIIAHQQLSASFRHGAVPNLVLDIGGEGRHDEAWNLNLSPVKTLGPDRGLPIPRLILGRAEAIPLPNRSAYVILVERTPLRVEALREISRVIRVDGTIILRHAIPPILEPHRTACRFLPGRASGRRYRFSGRWMQETVFQSSMTSSNSENEFCRLHKGLWSHSFQFCLAQTSFFQTSTGRHPVE